MVNRDNLIKRLIVREGGVQFSNRRADRGGRTVAGITEATWRRFLGDPAADIEKIKESEILQFYQNSYPWETILNRIQSDSLREAIFDAMVLHGVEKRGPLTGKWRAIIWIQTITKVTVDGVFGPKTEDAINSRESPNLLFLFGARRILFCDGICVNDVNQSHEDGVKATQHENLIGWHNRFLNMMRVSEF